MNLDEAIFGAGCFWCVETIFKKLEGVEKVEAGYSGGDKENPTYEQVCSGQTGHAEVIKVYYDKNRISYEELLQVFWKVHDPTTLNRQGEDIGTQYRSVIFYNNGEQKQMAEFYRQKLEQEKVFQSEIVTQILPLKNYYKAEDYHQDYYNLNREKNSYCSLVITPKIEKFKSVFKHKLKK